MYDKFPEEALAGGMPAHLRLVEAVTLDGPGILGNAGMS
jgi:hypothetical protein